MGGDGFGHRRTELVERDASVLGGIEHGDMEGLELVDSDVVRVPEAVLCGEIGGEGSLATDRPGQVVCGFVTNDRDVGVHIG